VRNYATILGLDAAEAVRRFRAASNFQGGRKATDLVFPEPVPERGFPAGVVMLLGAAIAIGSYAAWYSFSGGGERVVDTIPPVPARLEPTARDGEALRTPRPGPSQRADAVRPDGAPTSLPVPVQLPVSAPGPAP
jgi:cytoskeleton protein RodZ